MLGRQGEREESEVSDMSAATDLDASPPVKWAKVIDQTKCIGCHACSTACKSENQVPLSRLCLFRAGFHLTRLSGITFFGSHFDLLKRSAPSSAGALHLFATAW